MSIIEAFKNTITFIDGIKNEGIIEDYALIGGLALSAWIRPRTTKDIDLVVIVSKDTKWENIASIIETRLHKKIAVMKGTQRTHIKEKLSFMSGQIEVDIISTRGFDLAAEAIKNAVITEVFGKHIKVAVPEYLILLKLLPLSGQDAVDIKALVKKADIKKLKTLAQKHYLLTKLESLS
ncbi:MAG: nucleotidyl transferase AbiEii/AbiGii toxin family protein [Nitrospirae bacterium]|nr:nucleotidyl transferase AbiEii/AbiGii toxin family protein [Nitrospirota bacterium]